MEDGSNETSQNEGRCHTSQVYRGAHDFLQCHPCYTYGVMALTTRYPAFGAWDLQSLQLMEWYARRVFSLKLLRPEEHVIQDRVVTSRRYLRVPGHCTSSWIIIKKYRQFAGNSGEPVGMMIQVRGTTKSPRQ